MDVVILAAGLGSRLGEKTNEMPKAMVQVAGRELILRVMDFLQHPEIGSISVVAGYKADVLQNFLRKHCPQVKVLLNPHFEKGSILTLAAALPQVENDFLLMNVDHIYPRRMLKKILSERSNIKAICDFDRELVADDMKIKLNSAKQVIGIHKQLTDFDGGYIGMTFVGKSMLSKYKQAAKNLKDNKGDMAPVEWILGQFAEKNEPVEICDVSGFGWLEVDNAADLAHAEAVLGQHKDYLA